MINSEKFGISALLEFINILVIMIILTLYIQTLLPEINLLIWYHFMVNYPYESCGNIKNKINWFQLFLLKMKNIVRNNISQYPRVPQTCTHLRFTHGVWHIKLWCIFKYTKIWQYNQNKTFQVKYLLCIGGIWTLLTQFIKLNGSHEYR